MRILGLDLSLTATGAVLLKDGQIEAATVIKSKLREAARLDEIEHAIMQFCPGDFTAEVNLAAIEGYSFGAKNAREAMGELGGVVRLRLYREGIPYVVYAPTAWRKALTGKGNLSKDMVGITLQRKYAKQLDGHEFKTLDVLEAWAVAYTAWLSHVREQRTAR